MYKMLVLDFDDTLLSDDLTISKKNVDAIRKAKELGVNIICCSGRSDDSMLPFIEEMDTHDDHELFISFNGARIDSVDGSNVYLKPISQTIMRDLIDLGHEHNITTQLYYDRHVIVEEENKYSKVYQERTNMNVKVVEDVKELPYSTKVLFHEDDPKLLEDLRQVLIKKYGDVVNIFYSKPMYLEVLHKDVNKGLSVKYMAEKLNIKQDEVIAVGDSFNDIFMIEYAGLGVAVQNSRDEIKKVANYVTQADNNEDAIAEVVEKFILKK